MPSKDAHIVAARQNQRVIDYLVKGDADFSGWVVTVAFYKALHVVEAMFAVDFPEQPHTDTHVQRNNLLKSHQYSNVWTHYRPLWQASLIARYLQENENTPTYEVFSEYMPPEKVQSLILCHYLRQVEHSAEKRLGESGVFALPD